MELTCAVQRYDWGKCGAYSKVASFFKNTTPEFEIEKETPYAEMWMGTHPNGPSKIKATGEYLADVIKSNPECLGKDVIEQFGTNLPFLFKVLSIQKALSIQVHPTKEQAEILNAKHPELYKDPNHKPEIAIALTHFEALCGFRKLRQIQEFIKAIPELRAVMGGEIVDKILNDEEGAKQLGFKRFFTCPEDVMATQLTALVERLTVSDDDFRKKMLGPLIERLYFQFPGDCGCFAVYFLNFIQLEPLQAIYLGAGEPHAYLFGDCVECMACSDNVVRAGLTPKYKDVETLCEITNFKGSLPEEKIFKPLKDGEFSVIFKPPVKDFTVIQYEIPVSVGKYKLPARNSASIILIVNGTGASQQKLIPGTSVFIPAYQEYEIEVLDDLLIFQAAANV
ncbi:mannose-6-phosphate isomerase [Agrilus planipennis]|uniref:Mannose-6-phosphate isomerase n=1 Tax=Agrilus planipennis TaxID=224129 RepID=A0A1W4W578_AGRPL|nr:mannose-6-phosphate isomerase [Agrilus planipennis]